VAERFKKHREASTDREDGVVFRMKTKRKTTPAASALVASQNFLMTPPPLLAVMQGGDYWLHSICSQLLRPPTAQRPVESSVPLSSSAGGKAENTGAASARRGRSTKRHPPSAPESAKKLVWHITFCVDELAYVSVVCHPRPKAKCGK